MRFLQVLTLWTCFPCMFDMSTMLKLCWNWFWAFGAVSYGHFLKLLPQCHWAVSTIEHLALGNRPCLYITTVFSTMPLWINKLEKTGVPFQILISIIDQEWFFFWCAVMLFVLQDSGASSDTETEHLLSPVRVRRPPRMSLFRRYVTASILSSREPAGEWQECVHRCIWCGRAGWSRCDSGGSRTIGQELISTLESSALEHVEMHN